MTPGREEEWTLPVAHSFADADRYLAAFDDLAPRPDGLTGGHLPLRDRSRSRRSRRRPGRRRVPGNTGAATHRARRLSSGTARRSVVGAHGLGALVLATTVRKRAFDCCAEEEIRAFLQSLPVDQIAVAGAETDVRVLQSVLGLRALGYDVFLLEDCLFTSEPSPRPALDRLSTAGAIPSTYKSFFYEVVRAVGADSSLPPWTVSDGLIGPDLVPPERLPAWQPAR